MEPKLGADLSSVKVHTGGESAQAASGFGARAFTVGSDVHFGAGQYAPGTKEGDRLLAHELTHVVQGQRSGIKRKADDGAAEADGAEAKGDTPEVSQPGEPAEKEADHVGDHVADSLHDEHDEKKDGKDGEGTSAASKRDDGNKDDDKKSTSKDTKGEDGPGKESNAEGGPDAKSNGSKHAAGDPGSKSAPEADEKAEAKEEAAPISAKLEGVGRKVFLARSAPASSPSSPVAKGNPNSQQRVNMKPILGKLEQATEMFVLWQQRGTSTVASQVIAALNSAKAVATQLDAAQDSNASPDRLAALKNQLSDQLKAIQTMDPGYELFSIGDMALTVKHAQKKMDIVSVTFTCGKPLVPKLGEYKRQLKEQQDGINAMTCSSWLKNRDAFLARQRAGSDGRSPVGTQMQKEYNRRSGSGRSSNTVASHNSDQVSGGHPDPTGLPADMPVNSSIGGQWPDKIGTIDNKARSVPELQQLYTQMNVNLEVST